MISVYPDQTSYVTLPEVDDRKMGDLPPIGGWQKWEESRYDITYRINSYNDLWHLKQYVDAVNNQGITPTILIPNLLDAQADRRFNENESFGLKLVIQDLANMDAMFEIFHPHNPEVVEMGFELLGNPVKIIDNSEFVEEVFRQIKYPDTFEIQEDHILMATDAGGFKPLVKLADKLRWEGEIYSASKGRLYENGKSKLIQIVDRENFQGKNVIVIDDIGVNCGTFKGLSQKLKDRNIGKLDLILSHLTIQDLGQDPVTDYFDTVYTTNSKYNKYYGRDDFEPKNLKIINLF